MSNPTPPLTSTKRSSRWITPTLTGVAVAAIALFGGVLIGHNTASTTNTSSTRTGGFSAEGAPGTGGARAAGFGGARTSGTITAIDGDTITLKLADGSSVKVTTGSSTAVTSSTTAKVADLAAGDSVAVQGTTDASGNVTATSVSEGALTGGSSGRAAGTSSNNG